MFHLAARVRSAHLRHTDIHQHQLGAKLDCKIQASLSVGRFTDNFDSADCLNKFSKSLTKRGMVVHNDRPDGVHAQSIALTDKFPIGKPKLGSGIFDSRQKDNED